MIALQIRFLIVLVSMVVRLVQHLFGMTFLSMVVIIHQKVLLMILPLLRREFLKAVRLLVI